MVLRTPALVVIAVRHVGDVRGLLRSVQGLTVLDLALGLGLALGLARGLLRGLLRLLLSGLAGFPLGLPLGLGGCLGLAWSCMWVVNVPIHSFCMTGIVCTDRWSVKRN